MPLDMLEKKQIMDLLILSLEGVATAEDMQTLKTLLDSSDQARDYYVQAVIEVQNIRDMDWEVETSEDLMNSSDILSHEFWSAFAEQEKNAPAIEIPRQEPPQDLIQNVERVHMSYRFRKSHVATLILSAAALLLIVLFVKIVPEGTSSIAVATLVDQINVQWNQPDIKYENGDRLWANGGQLDLKKGLVKIQYDNGVDVIIEGPAVFEIERSEVFLEYGRAYSHVSKTGLGFTIKTPTSQFVDLGTEFGVQADVNGSSELHVIKGKVQMFAGSNGNLSIGQMIPEDQGVRYDNSSGSAKQIPVQKTAFVRHLDSAKGIAWRGQKVIDLADIVGGGDGLGSGKLGKGIDPLTGDIVGNFAADRWGIAQYVSVASNRYIDGVFVPNGGQPPVVVTSEGHVFTECPPTNNIFYWDIINSKPADTTIPPLWQTLPSGEGIYGTDICPCILAHANVGITFDLDAIRADYPSFLSDAIRFSAIAGLSPVVDREGNVDVCVLVDGQVRYSRKNITDKGEGYSVEINLNKSDRFLTLISTDGGDIDFREPGLRATDADWAVFVQPKLIFSDISSN